MKKDMYKNICEFAEKYHVNLYRKMPEGMKVLEGALTAPNGTIWITNGKPLFGGERINALLIDEWLFIQEIKSGLEKFTELEKVTAQAEDNYEREPENINYEKAFDLTYRAEFDVYMNVSNMLAFMLNIENKVARKMVCEKRNEIMSILERVA